jgi:hypothetical protein
MKTNMAGSAQEVRREICTMSDLDVTRFYYCYEIGSTFTALSLMESDVISAMLVCNKVKLNSKLGEDIEKWQDIAEKQKLLQDSTLGSLIAILSKHSLLPGDLSYLRWIKQKRDFFIHRFFNIGCWPGEMNVWHINSLIRTLRYLQLSFMRASRKIWKIFVRAGLMQAIDLGPSGAIMMNEDFFDLGKLSWGLKR